MPVFRKAELNGMDVDDDEEGQLEDVHSPVVRGSDADGVESVSDATSRTESIVEGADEGLQETVGIVARLLSRGLHVILPQVQEPEDAEQVHYDQEQEEGLGKLGTVQSQTLEDVLQVFTPAHHVQQQERVEDVVEVCRDR